MTESLKYPNHCITKEQGVACRELCEEKLNVIRERLKAMDAAIVLAREMVDSLMEGFPQQYVRKGDSDVALTEMKAQVSMAMVSLNKIDLTSFVPKAEYNLQHKILNDKIEAAQVDIAEKTEMARKTIEDKTGTIKENSELKIGALDKRLQDSEKVLSNMTGRILGTGAAVIVAMGVIQFIIHYYGGK